MPKSGESIQDINVKYFGDKPIEIFEFNDDYSLVSVKKEALPSVVCADCPEYMKEVLVKYHRAEPTKGFNDKPILSTKFKAIPKYYITTVNDNAIPYPLQQKMIKDNGTIKKIYEMQTSHLPFVVKPNEFIEILKSI